MIKHGTSLGAINDNRGGAGLVIGQPYALCCADAPCIFEISSSLPFLHFFSNPFSCQTRTSGKPLPSVPWQLCSWRRGKTAFQVGLILLHCGDLLHCGVCRGYLILWVQYLKLGLLSQVCMGATGLQAIWCWSSSSTGNCTLHSFPNSQLLPGSVCSLTSPNIPSGIMQLKVMLKVMQFKVKLRLCWTEHIQQGIQD